MSKKLKFGIIGYGNQGGMYTKFILDNGMVPSIDLVAICDIDEAKRDLVKASYPDVEVFDEIGRASCRERV